MFTEIWQSLKENVNRRITNPFLGTFTIIYIIRNWELFYSLFNFDPELKLAGRLVYIRNYFETHNFVENILCCILYTFIFLIATYVLLALSRLLSNFNEDVLMPNVYKLTGWGKIILKEKYNEIDRQKNEFETKYESERTNRIKTQTERDEYEKKLYELTEAFNNLGAEKESLKRQLTAKDHEVQSLRKQSSDKDDKLQKIEENLKHIQLEIRQANNLDNKAINFYIVIRGNLNNTQRLLNILIQKGYYLQYKNIKYNTLDDLSSLTLRIIPTLNALKFSELLKQENFIVLKLEEVFSF